MKAVVCTKYVSHEVLQIKEVPKGNAFGITESSVLRINICAKKPAHIQSVKR